MLYRILTLCALAATAYAQEAATRQVEIFGQKIYYQEAGSGPEVILLHGLGGDKGNWRMTLLVLAARFHVYAPDGRLGAIIAPTLIVWGRDDMLIPLAAGEALAEDIAGSKTVVLDGCGHVPQMECAAPFNDALVKFLGQ